VEEIESGRTGRRLGIRASKLLVGGGCSGASAAIPEPAATEKKQDDKDDKDGFHRLAFLSIRTESESEMIMDALPGDFQSFVPLGLRRLIVRECGVRRAYACLVIYRRVPSWSSEGRSW